jgi:hypothetical protein
MKFTDYINETEILNEDPKSNLTVSISNLKTLIEKLEKN